MKIDNIICLMSSDFTDIDTDDETPFINGNEWMRDRERESQ